MTGLRGKMEAGWSRMNDLIIIQASQVRIYTMCDIKKTPHHDPFNARASVHMFWRM